MIVRQHRLVVAYKHLLRLSCGPEICAVLGTGGHYLVLPRLPLTPPLWYQKTLETTAPQPMPTTPT